MGISAVYFFSFALEGLYCEPHTGGGGVGDRDGVFLVFRGLPDLLFAGFFWRSAACVLTIAGTSPNRAFAMLSTGSDPESDISISELEALSETLCLLAVSESISDGSTLTRAIIFNH